MTASHRSSQDSTWPRSFAATRTCSSTERSERSASSMPAAWGCRLGNRAPIGSCLGPTCSFDIRPTISRTPPVAFETRSTRKPKISQPATLRRLRRRQKRSPYSLGANCSKMRQAYLTAPRRIEWRDTPSPHPGPGELLVRVRAALTCGTDLKTYRRGHPKLGFGPFGHEASGDVIAAGEGVETFAPGQAVMWVHTAPCFECDRCNAGFENLCERLFDDIALGAYGDQLLLPARVVGCNVFAKPAGLSYIEAAFLEPLSCVVHGWNVLKRADA